VVDLESDYQPLHGTSFLFIQAPVSSEICNCTSWKNAVYKFPFWYLQVVWSVVIFT